ncbi:MAG: ATP-grasp domain-containing protein [archaeon]|nr:ATP-grasp domain-containing protein [archaeon]
MDVAIIAETRSEDIKKLLDAFKARKLSADFVDVGSVGVIVEKNVSSIFHDQKPFEEYNSVFLSLPAEFTLFAEPFLSELVDMGTYCQLKPTSYYILSNKPYMYSTLNSKGVKIPKTDILADKETIESSLKAFSYPMIVKTFVGLKKTNSVLLESERSLRSFVKSISVKIDAITIQEYIEGDVDQSLVIGEEVFSIKRKWVEKDLSHSKKPVSVKLSDEHREMAIKAAKVCGVDIGVVKIIEGKVTNVRTRIDFNMFNETLSKNMYEKVASHYESVVKGK